MGGQRGEGALTKILFHMGGERGKGANKDTFPHGWAAGEGR